MIFFMNSSNIENGFWQGTLIYMEIGTGEEIDPNLLVALQRRYKVLSRSLHALL